MANRKRGTQGVIPPELRTEERILTKQESTARHYPACPPVPYKLRKTVINTERTLTDDRARRISYLGHEALSAFYDPGKNESYLAQIFPLTVGIGEGSFGKVYHGVSNEDNLTYAIKKLKPIRLEKHRYDEVRNNEDVGFHPNVVEFILAWEQGHEIYLQLEYCSMSVDDYVELDGEINTTFLLCLLHDIANALEHLHWRDYIHLDVKPGNIMLKQGIFKLCDFGTLVQLASENKRIEHSLSDGDSKYLAKEVLEGIYHPACDIFGLGITLMELAGNFNLPGEGILWHQLRHNILPKEFYDCTNYSHSFKVLVETMMKDDYKLRPTAKQLLKVPCVREFREGGRGERPDFDTDILMHRGMDDMWDEDDEDDVEEDEDMLGTPPLAMPNQVFVPEVPIRDIRRISLKDRKELFRRALFSQSPSQDESPECSISTDDSFDKDFARLVDDNDNALPKGSAEVKGPNPTPKRPKAATNSIRVARALF